jgi:hypothetical protein
MSYYRHDSNWVLQYNIPASIKNVIIINIRGNAKIQLVSSQPWWEHTTEILVDRSAFHFCICSIDRRRVNLALRFWNKNFLRKVTLKVNTLLLIENAASPFQISQPFSLGDQAAVRLLMSGIVSCPYDLAVPLFTFKTVTYDIPIFENFLEKKKLVPTCNYAEVKEYIHEDNIQDFF